MAQVNIPKKKLSNGQEIPVLAFGTWFGFDDKMNFSMSDAPKVLEALSYAIDIGYRHVDTAHFYRIEPEVGQVIKRKIEEGVVKREDIFLATKVWQHMHREADVEKSVRGSLRRLDVDYLDLILIHFPMSVSEDGVDEEIDYLETYRGLETVLKKGLVRGIGVSNFNLEQMTRLLSNCQIPPVCNQIEVNLHLAQTELVDFCHKHQVQVEAYSPFGNMSASRTVTGTPTLMDSELEAIAKKYRKTVPQIILRHLYQRGLVVIAKTMTKSRLLENASIFDFSLDERDIVDLQNFNSGKRFLLPSFYQNCKNYPFEEFPGELPPIPESFLKWTNGMNGDIE